ncbi:immunoglobulin-like domain-containing protein [Atopobium fossor]|uniref:immunoglobulin-like domain-containing protein n=1 Tax=Atopobium fossor TaxID=39487 RepID=UPI00041E203E|nr:immunoglobulin-like domain-containing protein [Atopobium fossor]
MLSDIYDSANKQLTIPYSKVDFPNGIIEVKFDVLPDEKHVEQERYLNIHADNSISFSDGFVSHTTNDLKLKLNALVLVKPLVAAPTLEVEDKTIEQGDALELTSLVKSASDFEGTDLVSKVQVINDGGFKNDVLGKYVVTFKVVDKLGASATKKATVTVNPKMAILNAAPTLEVQDKTITAGDKLDLASLVTTATDQEDGDLTASVQIIDNGGFDNSKVGEYSITFRLVDKSGATVTKTAMVTVKAVPAVPETPTKSQPQVKSKTQILPQTGDATSTVVVAGVGVLGAAFIAFARRFKKNK